MARQRIPTLRRSFEISGVVLKYFLFYKLTASRKERIGRRMKRACEELGLAFVKIGQILSMRYDLLSQEDCGALQELLDNVNPIPVEMIFKIIEAEYGVPWRMIFLEFDKLPLGSASVSQVHRARIHDGSVMAVKIKRPGADDKFSSDIKILKVLACVAGFLSPTLRRIRVRELAEYFEQWIRQDLDFPREVRNMRRLKEQYEFSEKNFRPDLGKGMFPAPREDFCTENIIVMDFIDGIPMSQREAILANPEYDIKKSVKTYVNAAMRNWFRDDIETYIFQADPHLSNVLALPHGDAANVDCGLICELSKKEIALTKGLIVAVYIKDIERVVRIATEMTEVNYERYGPILRPDLEAYLARTSDEGIGFWFLEFTRVMIKNRMKFPLFLTSFGRTNVILDGLAHTYLPDETTIDILGEELKRQIIREMFKNLTNGDWLGTMYALTEKLNKSPELMTGLINRYFEDPLQMVRDVRGAMQT